MGKRSQTLTKASSTVIVVCVVDSAKESLKDAYNQRVIPRRMPRYDHDYVAMPTRLIMPIWCFIDVYHLAEVLKLYQPHFSSESDGMGDWGDKGRARHLIFFFIR